MLDLQMKVLGMFGYMCSQLILGYAPPKESDLEKLVPCVVRSIECTDQYLGGRILDSEKDAIIIMQKCSAPLPK